ncbi:FG-GAP-like repeat-containing protein [Streptomyces griseoviridis]|uniref:Esterase n=1 Tax=Streptomyces griseoviridis TaxID=45398 RepID=A0A918L9D5_STRGD|nr:FG-GAP-like repeat-containing protein [Streptomyces niveoruber]GGS21239.1 esterase [Streptomyces niveoruber]
MPAHRSRAALTAGLLAGVVTAGCLTTTASAATGGAVADTAYAFTARLDIGDGTRACSAALVAPAWLATSAACFTEGPGAPEVTPGAPARKTTATIGRTDLTTTAGQVREVVELVPRADRDLVLARLASPTTGIAPVRFAASAPVPGEELTLAGFGRTRDEWAPTRLHTATLVVGSVSDTTVALDGRTDTDAVCAGDAGGPLVRRTDTGFELVALGSRSWQGGCWGTDPAETRNEAVSPRTDDIAGGSTLAAGSVLTAGDTLTANATRLTLRADGDLAVVSRTGRTLWSTGTAGHPGATARFTGGGNLTVVDADGTTVLWESGTTAPGGTAVLQDRGDFVIRDADGVSRWSAGTVVRHDYDGDGRSDLAAWYDHGDGHDSLQTLLAGADGTLGQPFPSYSSAVGSWNAANMRFTTGDYDGDGRGDMAALYGYSDGSVRLFTALGKADGGFAAPVPSWEARPGGWTAGNMTLHSGDFDGDGRDDIAAWYDYDNGDDRLFTFAANATGGFAAPVPSWSNTANDWNRDNLKFVVGDFDGDGRDDLGGLYRHADGSMRTYSFLTDATGGFRPALGSWGSATFGDWNRTHVYAGDFDGDGRDDIAAWYDYADGHDAVHVLRSSTTKAGVFETPYQAYTTAAGNFTHADMRVVPGDYDGDGRDDLAALYGYSDGKVRAFTWTSRADGGLNGAAPGWASATTTGWDIGRSTFLRSAN